MAENIQVFVQITLTNGRILKGTMQMLDAGYRSRVTDLLNSDKQFLPLKNVTIYQGQGLIDEEQFVALNKNEIVTLSIDNYKDTEF